MTKQRTNTGNQPDFSRESALRQKGFSQIAGVDEVGRGPLAGPVVAAAVILDADRIPEGLRDSKALSEKRRNELFSEICSWGQTAIASIPAHIIDEINIRQASLLAMRRAIFGLAVQPDYVLVDGRDTPGFDAPPSEALIKGDKVCISIAAASIVAKVIRDRMMAECHLEFPEYGFDENKGYPTQRHRTALSEVGPCEIHRTTFGPVKACLVGVKPM